MKPIIGRMGGKTLLKHEIVNEFPKGYEKMMYVEPFFGGGSIFFYKNPSKDEVINDLDKDVYVVYKGIQRFNGEKISKDINGSYSKKDFFMIKDTKPKTLYDKCIRNLLLFKLSYYCLGITYGGDGNKILYINSNLSGYKERLQNTSIHNKDYKKIIQEYDSKNTFFYLDPPYQNSNRLYTHDIVDIEEIFKVLSKIKGKFLLSYNYSNDVIKLFKNYNINVVNTKYVSTGDEMKKELLIRNY